MEENLSENEFGLPIVPELLRRLCLDGQLLGSYSERKIKAHISGSFEEKYLMQLFADLHSSELGLDNLLKQLGPQGVINTLSESYLYHFMHGEYPGERDDFFVEDILIFEKRFKALDVQNERRLYLLGYFLKLCSLSEERGCKQFLNLDISENVDEYIKDLTHQGQFCDWYLLGLIVVSKLYPEEELGSIFKKKVLLNSIFEKLSSKQQELFVGSFLQYGYSIQNSDFILYQKVFV